jgi:hypothetical protein
MADPKHLSEAEMTALKGKLQGMQGGEYEGEGMYFLPDDALTTTPGESKSRTVARGKIADLVAQDLALAAQLGEVGAQLKGAGVEHTGSGKLVVTEGKTGIVMG